MRIHQQLQIVITNQNGDIYSDQFCINQFTLFFYNNNAWAIMIFDTSKCTYIVNIIDVW